MPSSLTEGFDHPAGEAEADKIRFEAGLDRRIAACRPRCANVLTSGLPHDTQLQQDKNSGKIHDDLIVVLLLRY